MCASWPEAQRSPPQRRPAARCLSALLRGTLRVRLRGTFQRIPSSALCANDFPFIEVQPLSNIESATIRKTALNSAHRQLGARMVDFNGWDMPVEYPCNPNRPSGGLIAEHLAVRASVGLFDVSHMGDIRLHGPQALEAVQHMTLNDAARLVPGQAQYSALL